MRTSFSKSELTAASFVDVRMVDAGLVMCNLEKTVFERCRFDGVDFTYSNLQGVCLDGQTFTGVKFDRAALNNVSFRGATLRNVSFRSGFALTNRYYRAFKTICFDDATMDKLTYASLKGLGADVTKVVVV